MYKIAHTSDTHIGEYPGPVGKGFNLRMLDICDCMGEFTTVCRNEKPDLIVHAGDLTNKSKLWADQANKETQIAIDWLKELAAIAPTVLLLGTLNHDNIEAFRIIKKVGIPGLYICMEPQLLNIQTRSGMIQVAAVPGFEKNYFRAQFPGLSAEEENKACTQALHDIIVGLGAQVDGTSPSILLSHYTIIGCQYDNGDHVFAANEVVINQATLESTPFDLVCMGHIHLAQKVPSATKPIYYAGTLQGLTFNEEGQEKGFWMHEIYNYHAERDVNPNGPFLGEGHTKSRFIKTMARGFRTIYMGQHEVEAFNVNGLEGLCNKLGLRGADERNNLPDFGGKIVRVKYECDEETNKIFNRQLLEKQLYNAGAFYVSEITPEKISIMVDKRAMNENSTPEENLRDFLKEKEIPEEEIAAILEIAAPLISTAAVKITAGKLTGIFEPVSLEVKNYRSFWEENFNFENITFATVNGINGNGKSAFFMDAIATCLYEETRSGDLTSWICNDPTNEGRSGAITFTFKIGDTKWRVSRTRAKGGKTTLNLSEEVNGQWENRSCEKTVDTQDKITKLLGMDAMTFKCCALIMQDQYGIFLQAGKEERMKVLADILGLGIYEELEDLTKKRITEENRELNNLTSTLSDLQSKIEDKDDLEEERDHIAHKSDVIGNMIQSTRETLKEAENEIVELKQAKQKADALGTEITDLESKIEDKVKAKTELEQKIEIAKGIIEDEPFILQKSKEHGDAIIKAAGLRAIEPMLISKEFELDKLTKDVTDLIKEKSELTSKLELAEKIVDKEPEILIKVAEYEKTKVNITELQTKQLQLQPKKQELKSIENELEGLELELIETDAKINQAEDIIAMSAEIIFKSQQYQEICTSIADMDVKAKKYFKLQQEVQYLSSEKTRIAETGAHEINLISQNIVSLQAKADMLNSSNCIDPNNAKCAFLADALEAKEQLEHMRKHLLYTQEEVAKDNEAAMKVWKDKVSEKDSIGFDDEKHKQLQTMADTLRPYFEKAAKLEQMEATLKILKEGAEGVQIRWQQATDKSKLISNDILTLENELKSLFELESKLPELEKWVNAKDRLPAAKETMTSGKDRIEAINKSLQVKQVEVIAIEKEIMNLKAQLEQLKDLELTLMELSKYVDEEKRLPAAKETMKLGQEHLKSIESELNSLLTQINNKKQDRLKESDKTEGLFIAEIAISKIRENLLKTENEQKELLQRLGGITERLQVMTNDINRIEILKKVQVEQANKVVILQKLAQAFSPDGIPFKIIRNILPELTNISNNILAQMTGGKMAIEIKPEKVVKSNKNKEVTALEVFITDVQHGTLPYLDKSGGQRVKAALASVLGLAEIKRSRAGMQLAMLFIDEPPFLDDEGKQAYIDALETIYSRYTGIKIIAITHEQEMKARFPQSIEVVATEQGSKVIFD